MLEISDISFILQNTLRIQNNILFFKPCIVYRESYSGRNIIANNSDPEKDVDDRNYFPVERWIASKTLAENEKPKLNEGLSFIVLKDHRKDNNDLLFSFKDLILVAEKELLGDYSQKWPLTKILDIGGKPVKLITASIKGEEEVPPIPAHVHSGNIVFGHACGAGKKEAYFFPPLDLPPYRVNLNKVITRLGVRPDVTKEDFEIGLKQFGKDDTMYSLLNVFPIKAYDGWTILPGIIHSPGPWLTFEIQFPQDDFNLSSWKLGQQILEQDKLEKARQSFLLKGVSSEREFINELVKWDLTTDPNFKEKFYRPIKVLEEGTWGRRIQIFFDEFYGEGFEVKAGKTYLRKSDVRPFSGIVWSGNGTINSNPISCSNLLEQEFLVIPNTHTKFEATTDLFIYVVFPLEDK